MKVEFICESCGKKTIKNKFSYNKSGNLNLCTSCIRKKNIFEKYGVENVSQLKDHREKIINSNREKYGVDFYSQTDEYQKRVEETNIKKYGVKNVSQSKDIYNKIKATNLKKYGVENPMQNKNFQMKAKNTLEEKYGGGPLLAPGAKEKRENTLKEKYGDDPTIFYNTKGTFVKDFKEYLSIKKMELIEDLQEDVSVHKIQYPIHIKCHCGNVYELKCARNLFFTNGCFKHWFSSVSKEELDVKEYIESLGFKTEKYTMNNKKHIDIYIPEKRIGFEFDGLYWHSQVSLEERGINPFSYHLEKTKQAKLEDIKLYHIFEDEWIFKNEIVKNKIKSLLGLVDEKIYARETKIKRISSKIKNEFLNIYHIQGGNKSLINLGAYYNQELVGVMCFSKPRGSTEDTVWELSRFSSKCPVIGLASKMISFFIRQYEPNEIISFSDKRWSTGNMYKKIGFEHIKNIKPSYWYFNNKLVRKHKSNFKKENIKKLFENYNESQSEYINMLNNNYNRIWDCGLDKWGLKIKKAVLRQPGM